MLVGDHAGNAVPAALGTLGIDEAARSRHIGWDIGVRALGEVLAGRLDAPFVHQHYSRLVIDCNRSPEREDAIPEISDGTTIPGNHGLTAAQRAMRVDAVHAPYHAAIAGLIAERDASGRSSTLVALHSFTPVMAGFVRPWHIGILHDGGDPGFAIACLAALRRRGDLIVGDNEPYRMDTIDYTIPRHAYPARRAYAEVEVRQDLLAVPGGVEPWANVVQMMLDTASS